MSTTTFNVFKEQALETAARDAIRLDESRALLDRFVTLVRESGTPAEETAGRYIVEPPAGDGRAGHAPHAGSLHQRAGARRADDRRSAAPADGSMRARPPAMARSTGDEPVEGEICYVPSRYAAGTSSLFDTPDAARAQAHTAPIRWRAASCSPRASRCRARCRRSSAAAPSRRSTSIPASAFTKASARRSGARRRWSRSASQADDAGRLHQPSGRRSR